MHQPTDERVNVKMLAATIGAHEIVFRLAAQSGVFHPMTRARIAILADQYQTLRLELDKARKSGHPIPGAALIIGQPEEWGVMQDIERVGRGEDHGPA